MSRRKYVSVNDFSGEIVKIYVGYIDSVRETTDETIRDIAKESKDQLKIEGDFQNRTGRYRKGWKVTFNEDRFGIQAVIHNKVYQLTHLLESGHAKWLFGRDTGEEVQAFPHIEKVNEETHRRLEEELARRLNDL